MVITVTVLGSCRPMRNLCNIFIYEGVNGCLNNIAKVDKIFDEGWKELMLPPDIYTSIVASTHNGTS